MTMTDNDCQLQIEGTVVHGHQLGRRLGFPTANLDVSHLEGELPPSGVYAAWATLQDGSRYPSMVNVGYRPTVDNQTHTLSVEANLDGYDGDLYGQRLTLFIVSRIRDERRMASLDQLIEQLHSDLEAVRLLLK